MIYMYNWICKHKIFIVILFILIPLLLICIFSIIEFLLSILGFSINIDGFTKNEIFMFYGTVLSGFATLLAVVITIEQSDKLKKIEDAKKNTPLFVFNPLSENNNINENDINDVIFIKVDDDIKFVNVFDSRYITHSFLLQNYGKDSAIGSLLHCGFIDSENITTCKEPFCLSGHEKVIIHFLVPKEGSLNTHINIEIRCNNMFKESFIYEYRAAFYKEDDINKYSMNLMPNVINKFKSTINSSLSYKYRLFGKNRILNHNGKEREVKNTYDLFN